MASTAGAGTAGHAHGPPAPGSADSAGDPCSLDPAGGFVRFENGDIRYSYVIAPDHPSGLYWFHPHPHGLSEVQVSNGLSGLMSIGSFWDTAYIKCRITASTDVAGLAACRDQQAEREADRSLQVRYLGLKDIQVAKLADRRGRPRFRLIEFPLRPDPGDRSAQEAFEDQNDARKNRCGKLGLDTSAGEITYAEGMAAPGQCWQKQHPDERWIF